MTKYSKAHLESMIDGDLNDLIKHGTNQRIRNMATTLYNRGYNPDQLTRLIEVVKRSRTNNVYIENMELLLDGYHRKEEPTNVVFANFQDKSHMARARTSRHSQEKARLAEERKKHNAKIIKSLKRG